MRVRDKLTRMISLSLKAQLRGYDLFNGNCATKSVLSCIHSITKFLQESSNCSVDSLKVAF